MAAGRDSSPTSSDLQALELKPGKCEELYQQHINVRISKVEAQENETPANISQDPETVSSRVRETLRQAEAPSNAKEPNDKTNFE